MKVKKINFPKFEAWYQNYFKKDIAYETIIGFYAVAIGTTAWSTNSSDVLVKAAVADKYHATATNIYADNIVDFSKWVDRDNKEVIKQWYEEIIVKVNEEFVNYIKKTYLEG